MLFTAYTAMWRGVALPAILYGLEALPFDEDLEHQLEQVQLALGKSILGVRQSTAGMVVYTELGLKPISLLISERKIRYISSVLNNNYKGSQLVKLLMIRLMEEKNSPFYQDLKRRLEPIKVLPENITVSTVGQLNEHVKHSIMTRIDTFKSLDALPRPTKWWRKALHLQEEPWSQALTEFRCGNAKLGNRDNSLEEYAVTNTAGRVVSCPLCLVGPNNEIHLLVECDRMQNRRKSLMITSGLTFHDWLQQRSSKSSKETTREFLGQERKIRQTDLTRRGEILIEIREAFFSKIYGRLISQQ